MSFLGLIQRKERLAQVGAAADRAASRPGQAFTLLKIKRAIETARRCQLQAPITMLQAFLQMSQMAGDLALRESNPLREVPGRKGLAGKRLQNHFTGSLLPFRRGWRFGHLPMAIREVIDHP